MSVSPQELQNAIMRQSLFYFTRKAFETIEPSAVYEDMPHIPALCYQLERCANGPLSRFMTCMPPRTLKSICISVAFPAWVLGHEPSAQFICASYSESLAFAHARHFRRVIDSAWYKTVFPNTKIDPLKNTEQEVAFVGGGFRYSTSIGGTLTGRGCHFLIIDDPVNANEVTKVGLKATNEWFDGVALSRLNPYGRNVVIIAMQRLHVNDLVGHVIAKG